MQSERIYLYQEGERAYLDSYLLNRPRGDGPHTKRGAVLVLPGGGYTHTAGHEGEPVAMKFLAAGYHAFVLSYRVEPKKYTDPLEDAARAILLIREQAEKWEIDAEDITVCGFSAGAHLAACCGVHWNKPFLSELLGVPGKMLRPNRMILGYPVITASGEFCHEGSFQSLTGGEESLRELFSLEKQVTEDTPPTFLWHTAEDRTVPVENSLLFATALSAHQIPFEMHIYPHGRHGMSICEEHILSDRPGELCPECADWALKAVRWLGGEKK